MTTRSKLIAGTVAIVLIAGAVVFWPRGGAETYEIGFAGPITGPQADYGRSTSQGAQLRIDEINAAGGVNGKPLTLLIRDDQAIPTQAVACAQEFTSNDRLRLVLGHFNSSCSNAAKPIYRDARLPQISYGSTNDDVPDGSEWTFRTPYKNSLQGRTLARYAANKLHAKRVGIITENEAYGRSLAKEFKEEAATNGLEVVAEESYDVQTTDYRPICVKLRPLALDAILLAGFHPQIQALVKQARDAKIKSVFLAGDGVGSSTEFITKAGGAAEGTYATGPFLIERNREAVARFREKYSQKYGAPPDSWAVYAYDAVGLAGQALREVGPDRKAVRDYMAGLNSPEHAYPGLIGPLYFDANRNAVNKDVTIAVVRNGRYEIVE